VWGASETNRSVWYFEADILLKLEQMKHQIHVRTRSKTTYTGLAFEKTDPCRLSKEGTWRSHLNCHIKE
jgi:hypothetical protein